MSLKIIHPRGLLVTQIQAEHQLWCSSHYRQQGTGQANLWPEQEKGQKGHQVLPILRQRNTAIQLALFHHFYQTLTSTL